MVKAKRAKQLLFENTEVKKNTPFPKKSIETNISSHYLETYMLLLQRSDKKLGLTLFNKAVR